MKFWTLYDADGKVVSQDQFTRSMTESARGLFSKEALAAANKAFPVRVRLLDASGNYVYGDGTPVKIGTTINVRYPTGFKREEVKTGGKEEE